VKPVLKWLALLAGLLLLGWYITRADLAAVGQALLRLGWLAPLVLAPYFLTYIADCMGWRFAFAEKPGVRFLTLFRIRWAGESLNNVVPSAYIGGEALKVYLLQKQGVPAGVGAVSAVVSKTAQTVAQLLLIAFASIAFWHVGGDHPGLRAGLILVFSCGVLGVAGLFWIQRRGLLTVLCSLARIVRLRLTAIESRWARIEEVDRTISGFYRRHPRRFLASTGFYFTGWIFDTMEIYLVSHLLGMPITWWQALCVEAFTGVAKALGMWIPGSLGVQESGIVLLGRLAGLPDTLSFTYALIRRAREIIFVIVGWALLYGQETPWRNRSEAAPSPSGQNLDAS
jgi:putative membrane protein